MNQLTCCCFDLETTNLDANFGIVLCGVVKAEGRRPRIFRGDVYNESWESSRSNDGALVQAICFELCKYDIWVAHNGRR